MLGLGVMIHELAGGNKNPTSKYYGKKIKNAVFENDKMRLDFKDGISIVISDHGQSCCENRYMTCDDDVKSLIGQKLVAIATKEGPEMPTAEYDNEHEVVFLEIQGDQSSVSFATHNEHNGWYGGFSLQIEEMRKGALNA